MSPRNFTKPLGLLAGLVLGSAVLAPPGAAADDASEDAQLIVVHGNGEVRVPPDSLRVDVGVEVRASTVDEAQRRVNAAAQRVIDEVKRLDYEGLKVETRVVQVSPVYSTGRSAQPPAIVGYSASNHVSVTLRGVPTEEVGARGAHIIDTAVQAGANSVGGIELFLADPTSAEDNALAAAVHAAAHDADTIARASGVTLGPLYAVEESPGMQFAPRALAREGATSTPIEAEEIVVQSNVTAKYSFH